MYTQNLFPSQIQFINFLFATNSWIDFKLLQYMSKIFKHIMEAMNAKAELMKFSSNSSIRIDNN